MRPAAKGRNDMVLLVAAFVVVIALLAWAAFWR
jgi:hypothetical protein